MKLDTPNQFSLTTLSLHWIVGLTIIGLLATGVYMVETTSRFLFPWHKSFGVIILIFVIPRLIWRMKNGWPVPVGQYRHIEHIIAKIIHWVLILGTILMPVTGILNSSLGGYGIEVFGFELIAKNIDPDNPKKALAYSDTLYALFHNMHYWLGYILIAALGLHVVGALKHHIIDKDGTLKRMFGAKT